MFNKLSGLFRSILPFIAVAFPLSELKSEDLAILKGTVKEKSSNTIVVGALLNVQNHKLGSYTNKKGNFTIRNVPYGVCTLKVSCIGYKSIYQVITIDKQEVILDYELETVPYSTEEIVVSASKRVQAVQDVPISISVVDQRSIADRSITKIDDALRYVSGVNIAKDQVSIRGSSGFALGLGSRTAMLLDGFPILSGDNADIKFDMLPMMDIERIEVIKGAGSALYGTGALGGVVSIFTRSASDESRIQLRTFSGIYDTPSYKQWEVFSSNPLLYGIDGSYSKRFDKLSINISGGYKYDRSYRMWDDSKRWNVYSKIGYSFSESTSAFLFVNAASEERGNLLFWADLDSATSAPSSSNLNERRLSKKVIIGTELKHILNDKTFITFRASTFNTSFDELYKRPGEEVIASDASTYFSDVQFSSSISEENHLTFGGIFTLNTVNSDTYGTRNQTIGSGYLQFENSSIKNLVITAGGRLDLEKTETIDQNNLQFSPKLGISYIGFSPMRLRASYGRGFRTPAVAERFANIKNPFPVNANPNLTPEYSTTFELGASSETVVFGFPSSWDFSIYQTDFVDLIEPQVVLNSTSAAITFNNVLKARIQGAELTFRSMLDFIGLETSLTAMYARNTTLNTPLKFRSPILWYNRIWVPISDFEVQLDYRFIARSERILDENEQIFANYINDVESRVPIHVLDARLVWDMNKKEIAPLKMIFNVKNLLNYYYVEVIGNLAPIRNFTLQCELNL